MREREKNQQKKITTLLGKALNGQEKFAEAEKVLSTCQNPNDPSILINRIVAALHENKSPNELIANLQKVAPDHAWFKTTSQLAGAFDEAIAKVKS